MTPISRKAPELDAVPMPSYDIPRSQLLSNVFDGMNHQVDGFAAALEIFDYGEEQGHGADDRRWEMYRQWQFIAARDGAITIYNFGASLGALVETVNASEFFSKWADKVPLREARRAFDKAFPDAMGMRHSVAHAVDKIKNVRTHVEKHGYTGNLMIPGLELGPVKDYLVVDHLEGRTLFNSWEKKIVKYTIDQAALDILVGVRGAVFDLFDAVVRVNKLVRG